MDTVKAEKAVRDLLIKGDDVFRTGHLSLNRKNNLLFDSEISVYRQFGRFSAELCVYRWS